MKNIINWFEIPATDFERAVAFYEKVFATKLKREDMGAARMGVFPCEEPATGGCVCQMPELKPGDTGAMIYLDASPDVGTVLKRAAANGGKVVLEEMLINDCIGYIGAFIDTEGNRVGIHAGPAT